MDLLTRARSEGLDVSYFLPDLPADRTRSPIAREELELVTRPLVVAGRALTCRLAMVREDGEARDLGRVDHEVTAVELFDSLPDRETDAAVVYVLELWEESPAIRWLRDEREVEESVADVLLDGRLAEILGKC